MVWEQEPAGLVEVEHGVWGPSAVTKSYYMKNPWKRKQEWASYCDLEFPKPCLRLERQFQAPEKCLFRSVLSNTSQPLSRRDDVCSLLPVWSCCN